MVAKDIPVQQCRRKPEFASLERQEFSLIFQTALFVSSNFISIALFL